jgi:SRSO17 transposase
MPVDFALLSSNKKANRYQEMNENIDKRSCGYRRRKEAISKSTELIVPMLKRALNSGIKAKYLLMDSWFGFPSIITPICKMINVICMVKNMKTIFYYQEGKSFTLSQLYKKTKKRRGRAAIKGSQIVEIKHGEQIIEAKIVFVKNRNKKREWLAILSTDVQLTDEEIVRIYGKRWDIEVFFKMMKQNLNLNGEVELRSYDGMIAHITIVMLRYIFLTVEQRNAADDKTFGGVFRDMLDEMDDITIMEALYRILNIIFDEIRQIEYISKEIVDKIMDILLGIVIEKYHFKQRVT